MPSSSKTALNSYHLLVSLISSLILVGFSVISPMPWAWLEMSALLLFIAIQVFLPVELFGANFYLSGAMVLAGGIMVGFGETAWACLLGTTIGILIRLVITHPASRTKPARELLLEGGFLVGQNLIALLAVFAWVSLIKGTGTPSDLNALRVSGPWMLLVVSCLFAAIHMALFLVDARFKQERWGSRMGWDWLGLIMLELLPIILVYLSLLAYMEAGRLSLLLLGAVISLLAVLVNYLSTPLRELERRVQELSTLTEISKKLSEQIELQNLLSAIQEQVTKLLQVDNFYVALLDPADGQIWYPLAVKNGQRQQWSRRPLEDRLTDRVIQRGEAILLPHHARDELAKIGLPAGEDSPFGWIGVPLVASQRTIGCLALFSMTPQVTFKPTDLNLLEILAGETSVAIEIALHNALLFSDVTIGRDRLKTVLNAVDEGIILVEADGQITLANEAIKIITGKEQSEFIGRKLSSLPEADLSFLGLSTEQAGDLLNQLSTNPVEWQRWTAYQLEIEAVEKHFERSIVPVESQEESPHNWVIVVRDVSEAYELRKSQDVISETLVHDLRSPLSAVLSALDMIEDALPADEPSGIIQPSVGIARRSAQRVLNLVLAMLEIARLQSGKFELQTSPVNLEELVEQSFAEFRLQAQEFQLQLINQADAALPAVVMDQGKILRVMNNLIDNAIKFSPDGEVITVSARLKDAETMLITVSDRGSGIPAEYQEKIFHRFGQVPKQESRRRGTGLGLTYCRLAVEAHGGTIWVAPRSGGGSEFFFTLPISGPLPKEPS